MQWIVHINLQLMDDHTINFELLKDLMKKVGLENRHPLNFYIEIPENRYSIMRITDSLKKIKRNLRNLKNKFFYYLYLHRAPEEIFTKVSF